MVSGLNKWELACSFPLHYTTYFQAELVIGLAGKGKSVFKQGFFGNAIKVQSLQCGK
jgi:hypothetical protein